MRPDERDRERGTGMGTPLKSSAASIRSTKSAKSSVVSFLSGGGVKFGKNGKSGSGNGNGSGRVLVDLDAEGDVYGAGVGVCGW